MWLLSDFVRNTTTITSITTLKEAQHDFFLFPVIYKKTLQTTVFTAILSMKLIAGSDMI